MSILDEIKADISAPIRCRTCTWLHEQPKEERDQWIAAFRDKTLQTAAIARTMRRHGFQYQPRSIDEHRAHHLERSLDD